MILLNADDDEHITSTRALGHSDSVSDSGNPVTNTFVILKYM